jgi:hypothetical protein
MKPEEVLQWFKARPATKAAWLAGIIGFLALITNTYVVYQNSLTINNARDAVLLSMEPSIEVQFQSDSAFVLNTTSMVVTDIRVHPITYKIQPEPFRILDRNKPGSNYLLAGELLARQRIPIPLSQLIETRAYNLKSNDPNIIRVAVITFRREVDLKRFFVIEIFHAASINGKLALFPIFSGKNTAVAGPPDYFVQLVNEIEKLERTFFKTSGFQ